MAEQTERVTLNGAQAEIFMEALSENNEAQLKAKATAERLGKLLRSWGFAGVRLAGYDTETRELLLAPEPAPTPAPDGLRPTPHAPADEF